MDDKPIHAPLIIDVAGTELTRGIVAASPIPWWAELSISRATGKIALN